MSKITQQLQLAIQLLQHEGIVAIPTETVYGLAGNAESDLAIQKIYSLKKRPLNHPLIMHIANDWDLNRWVTNVPDYAQKLMHAFWPGPLTLVFNARVDKVNPRVTGGQTTVAIRSPAHPIAQQILNELNFPLVAPSANPFGKISPTTAEHVQQSFADDNLLILDGGRCDIGIESTIIDATQPDDYQILRAGVITAQQLNAIVPQQRLQSHNAIRVSGKLNDHYQPEKPLFCFASLNEIQAFCDSHPDTYVVSFSKDTHFSSTSGYQLSASSTQAAYELYFELRRADQSACVQIVVELPPDEPQWAGVRERLLKAAIK